MSTRRQWAAAVAGTLGLATMAVVTTPTSAPAEVAARVSTGGGGYLAPYFTEGDLTGDDQLTDADLDLLVPALGTVAADAGWAAVAAADYDADGVITMTDVADAAQRVLYDDGPFDLLESSAVDMQKAMNAGVTTSVKLTQAYLDRITAYDGLVDGAHARALNSIITTGGPAALAAAAESDALRAANGGPRSMVDGIPIILKDNYDTLDMPTSAGHGSWETNQTADDAFMVDGLRDAGAVILAKATLDEFAFGFASEYTTNVPAGSSKLVASPYQLARTAGGSSGGTGASIAANLGAIGFGTDTGGSIRVPASYNQLVGIRPTVGLTSRDGIVPLALSQDTGGPIARTVSDAAIALDAVVGVDPDDPLTSEQTGKVPASYTEYLDPDALEGRTFGYVTSMVPTVAQNAAANRLFTEAVADLTAAGATVVPITTTALNPTLNEASGSTNEFKHDLNTYIGAHLDPDVATRDLTSIIASGRLVPSRAATTYPQRNNVTQAQYETWIGTHGTAIATGESLTTGLLDSNDLDALIYPSGTPYGTFSTNLRLSPNTGMPAVTVPMGQSATGETFPGAGVNLEFLGRNYSEGDLIAMTYAYEQATRHRTTPPLYPALAPAPAPAPKGAVVERVDGYTVTVSDAEVEIGDEVTVTVAADAAADLYAYDLDLGFDPEVLEYDGATTTAAMPYSAVEAGDGTVSLVGSELGSSPATTGPTTLATLTFTATGQGTTDVTAGNLVSVAADLTSATVAPVGSTPVSVDLLPAPVATTLPTVAGTARVGQLVVATDTVFDLDGVAVDYQWLRGTSPIAGATGPTYTITPADLGSRLSVVVTGTLEDHAPGLAPSAGRTVLRAISTTTVAVKPASPRSSVRPQAVVSVRAPGITPTGAVRVTYGGKLVRNLPWRLVGGTVTVTLPRRTPGTYGLKVTYVPTAAFVASTRSTTVRVRR
ncbi:amidase family protein [Nocardioides sp.]|uniref:amidase family protein n=1 Tax=Nocardioides sp. TaxID=35761 RepID=UPI002719AE97|nr:amidase family protein [Nocardioides sp.]MDO9454655.1 amidase family protein [Nocardioides sp.]